MNDENMNGMLDATIRADSHPVGQVNNGADFAPQANGFAPPAPQANANFVPQANGFVPPAPQVNANFAPQADGFVPPAPQANANFAPQADGFAPPAPQTNANAVPQPNGFVPPAQSVPQGYQPQGNYPPVTPAPKKKKSVAKIIILIVAAFVFMIFAGVGIILTATVIIPASKYSKATDLVEKGKYDEAVEIFNDLDDYKDSRAQIIKTRKLKEEALLKETIDKAKKLIKSGDKAGAYRLLLPEKDKAEVSTLLDEIEDGFLDDVSGLVYWNNDDYSSSYQWAHANTEDDTFSATDPYFYIYLAEKKSDSSYHAIHLKIVFGEVFYSYVSPIYPTKVRISTDNGSMDIPIDFDETDRESGNGARVESIDVTLSLEEAQRIAELFAGSQDVKMRVIGSSRHLDFTLGVSESKGVADIVKYITAVYTLNDLKAERAAEPETES